MTGSGARKMNKAEARQVDLHIDSKSLAGPNCVGISDALQPEDLLGTALDRGFNHICQKRGHLFDKEVQSSQCLIDSTDSFFEFPMATILTPSNLSRTSERGL